MLESGTMNFTMTKTFLSVWPFGTRIRSGTGTTMRVGSQLVGTPSTPLTVTVPCFVPKLFPLIVMSVFTGPQAGERLQKPACLCRLPTLRLESCRTERTGAKRQEREGRKRPKCISNRRRAKQAAQR